MKRDVANILYSLIREGGAPDLPADLATINFLLAILDQGGWRLAEDAPELVRYH